MSPRIATSRPSIFFLCSRIVIASSKAYAGDGANEHPTQALLADRHRIEQSLRRMLIRTVAGIDDGGLRDFCQLMRNTRGRMPHHDTVRGHCVEIERRVDECFALAQA